MHEEHLDTLARTIYGEARSEGYQGMLAVGWVVRNRADAPSWWGKSVSEVCRKRLQFSCWNEDDPNLPLLKAATLEDPAFRTAYRAALGAYDRAEKDPTNGATHYVTTAKPSFAKTWPPSWTLSMVPRGTVGAHMFYRED